MEYLIGMAVAAAVIVGVIMGNLFACTFATLATLPMIGYGLMFLNDDANFGVPLLIGAAVLLCIIWGPRIAKERQDARFNG